MISINSITFFSYLLYRSLYCLLLIKWNIWYNFYCHF